MEFPADLSLKVLEHRHPDYVAIASALQKIDDLTAGGHQIEAKKKHYLKMRPGEEPELYKLRVDRFTYTNVLGGAIQQQVTKLQTGAVTLSNIDYDDAFWESFREDTNGKGRSEMDLLASAFRSALKYKRVYFQVDKPYSAVEPKNKAHERQLGLDPYVCMYDARHCINWDEEKTWFKFKQYSVASTPFKPALTKCTWKFVTTEAIVCYEAYVKLDSGGKIIAILNEEGEEKESADYEDEKACKISLSQVVAHGYASVPIIVLDLADDLWATNQAYLKALEYLNLENSRYDTGMMVGYVQRTYEPPMRRDLDLDDTFGDDLDNLESSNATIIKGKFTFSEAQGSSIVTVSDYLKELRENIEALIGLGGNASTTKTAVQQSGISKKMDFVLQEILLRAYGTILTATYQDVLQMVAKMAGHNDDRIKDISVSGFNSFDVDSLENAIAIAEIISGFEDRIPPTALKLFYNSLSLLLAKNASAEQEQLIAEEIEQIFTSDREVDDDDDEI